MPKIIIIIVILLSISNVWSQTYDLNIYLNNGTTISFPVQDIKKITFDGLTNIEKTTKLQNLIKNFSLFQNYPNPFNPETIIEYELPGPGNVSLMIFDIKGQLVNKFSKDCLAGINKIIWDGKNSRGDLVATGVYFYQVKFKNSIVTKRMIFLK